MSDPATIFADIKAATAEVVIGNEDIIEGLTIGLLTGGHVLLEGVPGVAKTTLANVFARASGLQYQRIQMTPDMVPADITGTSVYRQHTGEFERQKGPIFSNLVVADEINRATPKTQSALLEAMQEQTVTIDGDTLALPEPFMVVATQNPIEMEGVFELPEAQRDRFQLKYVVDLPDQETEEAILDRFDQDPALDESQVTQAVSLDDIHEASAAVTEVFVSEPVKTYLLDIIRNTRESPALSHGSSPRGSLELLHTAKAYAAIQGREYVIPDDVKALATPVLHHRLLRSTDAELADQSVTEILAELLEHTPPPGAEATFKPPRQPEQKPNVSGED